MSYPFLKGHGTENDFVLLPDPDGSVHGDLSAERVRALCDRRAGIGGDGVLRVVRDRRSDGRGRRAAPVRDAATSPSGSWTTATPTARWRRCAATASGSSPATCTTRGWSTADEPVRIATRDGVKTLTRRRRPVHRRHGPADGPRRDQGRRSATGPGRRIHVDMGNPHAVAFVDDLAEAGPLLRASRRTTQRLYPDGVNVEFVVRRGPDHIAMRVHERGSGETRSCGTGACAAAVAARRRDGPGTLAGRRTGRRRSRCRATRRGGCR